MRLRYTHTPDLYETADNDVTVRFSCLGFPGFATFLNWSSILKAPDGDGRKEEKVKENDLIEGKRRRK